MKICVQDAGLPYPRLDVVATQQRRNDLCGVRVAILHAKFPRMGLAMAVEYAFADAQHLPGLLVGIDFPNGMSLLA